MAFPRELMRNVLWSFRTSIPDRAAFEARVRQYHLEIVESDEGWRPAERVLEAPSVELFYSHYEGDEEVDRTVTFAADDKKGFTAGELLWKINEDAVPRLKGQDDHFFEGLALAEPGDRASYSMLLGS